MGYISTALNPCVVPAAQPPGLPITLAPILAAFGPSDRIVKALMMAFAIAFLLLAGLYFARHNGLALGIGVVAMCGIAPGIPNAATQ